MKGENNYVQYYPDGQGFKLRPYFKMCLESYPGYQNLGLFQKMPGFFSLLNTFGFKPDKKRMVVPGKLFPLTGRYNRSRILI